MTRRPLDIAVAACVAVALLLVWIGSKTYWTEVEVPMPPKGEALTNPMYAAQRFVERVGGKTTREHALTVPSSDDIIVLSAWNWGLNPERAKRLERWVESGGRLVLDDSVSIDDEFSRWSGVDTKVNTEELEAPGKDSSPCRRFEDPAGALHWLCDQNSYLSLETTRTPEWQLREKKAGVHAVRMRIGAGSVSVFNGQPFRYRALLDGDHGWALVTAAGFKHGDTVHFLSESEYPSLLALTWRYGGPVVVLSLVLVVLMLWRGAVRFGPLAASPTGARRSLAEQIRGTGDFVFRHGGGTALHAASVRALDIAARQRIPCYAILSPAERTAALATFTGIGSDLLADALFHPESRRHQTLPETITLLETARRRLLAHTSQIKASHGTA